LKFRFIFRDLLYGKYYDAVDGRPKAAAAFLDALQPHILNDKLRSPPPALFQHLVNYFEATNNFQVGIIETLIII
jgi:hypothetical protein